MSWTDWNWLVTSYSNDFYFSFIFDNSCYFFCSSTRSLPLPFELLSPNDESSAVSLKIGTKPYFIIAWSLLGLGCGGSIVSSRCSPLSFFSWILDILITAVSSTGLSILGISATPEDSVGCGLARLRNRYIPGTVFYFSLKLFPRLCVFSDTSNSEGFFS